MSKAPYLSNWSEECLKYDRKFTRLSEGFKRARFARAPKPFEPGLTSTKANRSTAAAWSISGGNSGALPPNNGLRHLYEDSGDDQGRTGNSSLQESADIGHGNQPVNHRSCVCRPLSVQDDGAGNLNGYPLACRATGSSCHQCSFSGSMAAPPADTPCSCALWQAWKAETAAHFKCRILSRPQLAHA